MRRHKICYRREKVCVFVNNHVLRYSITWIVFRSFDVLLIYLVSRQWPVCVGSYKMVTRPSKLPPGAFVEADGEGVDHWLLTLDVGQRQLDKSGPYKAPGWKPFPHFHTSILETFYILLQVFLSEHILYRYLNVDAAFWSSSWNLCLFCVSCRLPNCEVDSTFDSTSGHKKESPKSPPHAPNVGGSSRHDRLALKPGRTLTTAGSSEL